MKEAQLQILLRKSPEEGYRALVDTYGSYVYAIVRNRLSGTGSSGEVEECVSDVFAELFFQFREQGVPDASGLKALIGTVAKRRAIDVFRQLSRSVPTISMEEAGALEQTQEQEAETILLRRQLLRLIESLGEPDCSILIRQYFYGCTVREIAAGIHMTAEAVQKRSLRARQRLKAMLIAEDSGKGVWNP